LLDVCKRTFPDIFLIVTYKIPRTSGHAEKNIRRQHTYRPHKIKEDIKQGIRDHINSFPEVESHYACNKTQYLHPDLTLTV
jgi:hypothetical protein